MTLAMKSVKTQGTMPQLRGLCRGALYSTESLLRCGNYSDWNYTLRDNLESAQDKQDLYMFAISFTEAMKNFDEHVRNSPVTEELEEDMIACWRATCTALEQSAIDIPLVSEGGLASQDCLFGKCDFKQLIAKLDWHIATVRNLRDRYVDNLQALARYQVMFLSDADSAAMKKIENALIEAAQQTLLPASLEAFWAAMKVYRDITTATGEVTTQLGNRLIATLRAVIEVAREAEEPIPWELLEYVEAIDKAYASRTGI